MGLSAEEEEEESARRMGEENFRQKGQGMDSRMSLACSCRVELRSQMGERRLDRQEGQGEGQGTTKECSPFSTTTSKAEECQG